jgi:hypothetical protein
VCWYSDNLIESRAIGTKPGKGKVRMEITTPSACEREDEWMSSPFFYVLREWHLYHWIKCFSGKPFKLAHPLFLPRQDSRVVTGWGTSPSHPSGTVVIKSAHHSQGMLSH